MKIIILGGDGYLGWPTALYFSARGHEILIIDNYFKRHAATEIDCDPLFNCPNLMQRKRLWHELTGRDIKVIIGDIANYDFLAEVIKESLPEVIIHYAEQPSAPYSMMDIQKATFTLQNNLTGTLNIIYAVKEFAPDCHIIKLGTMGEYGTPNIDIEEGWLEISHNGRPEKFLFPRQASSLYHTTKIQDTDLLWFYVRTWDLRVTDLMQGPVYGLTTDETGIDEKLLPSFHYDEIFGTVLNRFIVQAVAGYPLTVYGKGGQKRGYLNLNDTMQCVYLAAKNPAHKGELRIYNQITEVFSVNDLAEKVKKVAEALGLMVNILPVENPRREKEEHYYNPTYSALLELGLNPHYLTEKVLESMIRKVEQHKTNIQQHIIFRGVRWG